MGEDVGRYGGCFAVSKGLLDEFGPERIRDTPLSESAFVGAGIGAALGGMRPIVEIMTVNFSLLALDQIVNNAATILHMSGGQFNVPLVIRMATGGGRQLAAQHSHSLEGWYAHIPGIKVLTPATLEDARGMLWTALEDPDPVLIFEHAYALSTWKGSCRDAGAVDIDARRGAPPRQRRLRSSPTAARLHRTLEAAEQLATEGIDAEVIDLRVLRPLDTPTDPRVGSDDAPRGDRRRGLAQRQASRRRSARGSWNTRSTSSTLPSRGSAARRCPCPIRGTWSRRRCRSRRRSSRAAREVVGVHG